MNITGMIRVNCNDCERSREFYAFLGSKVMWEVPDQNTPEIAAALRRLADDSSD